MNKIKLERANFNLSFPEHVNLAEIDSFKLKFKNIFNIEVDNDYINFLKVCDGLTDNGFTIYSSSDH